MEDLGACYRDTTYQLVRGNDSERAEAAMMTHVAAIGRLHALTIGRRKEYESIRISLGGATEKSHLFQEQWPSARLAKISSFHQALVVATARWHIFKVLRHLNGCLAEDAPRGPTSGRPGESIGTPFLATHSMVNDEEARRVIFLLYRPQFRIVRSPKGSMPGTFEEVAFRQIGPWIRH
jgi:hypothetical protein